jgi:hypothetical protein
MKDKTLQELGLEHRTDKNEHGYLPIYEKYLYPVRTKFTSILELGVYNGNSLSMWRDWFPDAKIYGLDINPQTQPVEGCEIVIGSQDSRVVTDLARRVDGFDLIVDDASHVADLTARSWELLWESLRPGGYYIFEDLLCSYLKEMVNTGWPGMMFNDPSKLAAPSRAALDKVFLKIIEDVDNNRNWEFIHFYRMTAIARRK